MNTDEQDRMREGSVTELCLLVMICVHLWLTLLWLTPFRRRGKRRRNVQFAVQHHQIGGVALPSCPTSPLDAQRAAGVTCHSYRFGQRNSGRGGTPSNSPSPSRRREARCPPPAHTIAVELPPRARPAALRARTRYSPSGMSTARRICYEGEPCQGPLHLKARTAAGSGDKVA